MPSQPSFVVGLGEVLWDLLPEGRRLGGAPANFAFHASQFGFPTRVVSAVGPDDLGREIIAQLDARSIGGGIATVPYPTGTVAVSLDAQGSPSYDIRHDVAWESIPFSPTLQDLARQTRAVCFGSLAQRGPVSRATINAFIDALPHGSLVVFDVNLRAGAHAADFLPSMSRCDILKINEDEFRDIQSLPQFHSDDFDTSCSKILSILHPQILIVTCGAEGSYVLTSNSSSFLPSLHVNVADTVGAGDSFTAAFVASLLRGRSLSEAHERAVAVSAYVCSQPGAMPVLPPDLVG